MTTLTGENVLLRIFVGEGDRHGRKPLYEALLELLRGKGVAGATVLRGVAGFGATSVVHTDKLLELSLDLPMVVEAVDTEEKIRSVLPEIEPMMSGGLVTLEKVQVIHYLHKRN